MDLNATVTDAVRLTLVHQKMTRPALAGQLGWTPSKLDTRMTQRTPWTLADLSQLSRVFGIPEHKLFAGGQVWITLLERQTDAVRPTHGVQERLTA